MWQLVSAGVQLMDLRFPRRDDEDSFKKGLQEQLIRNSAFGCVFFLTASWIALVPTYVTAKNHMTYPFQWSPQDPRTQYFSIRLSQSLLVAAYMGAALLQWRLGICRWWNWELLVVCLTSYIMIAASLSTPWHIARLWDVDPDYLWKADVRNTELLNCLGLDTALTAASLFIPIRSRVLWVLMACAVLPYAAMALVVGSPFPVDAVGNVFTFAVLALFAFLGAHRAERSAREKWRAQRQVVQQQQELEKRHAAVCLVLDRFCDCVVHLGPLPSLQIMRPNPRFAALLLYTDGRTLQGSSICDWLASEEDCKRMIDAFKRDSGKSESTDVNHCVGLVSVHFRDIYGREFDVSVSHTCVHLSEDEHQFIVGIVESQERKHVDVPISNNTSDLILGQAYASFPADACTDLASPAPMAKPMALATSFVPDATSETVYVTFTAADFEVVDFSASFATLCGSDPMGILLSDWLSDRRNKRFWRTYMGQVNKLAYNSELHEIETEVQGSWLLQTPFLTSVQSEIYADVHLKVFRFQRPESENGSFDHDPDTFESILLVRAVLTNIKQHEVPDRHRRPGRSRRSDRSRSNSGSSASRTTHRGTERELIPATIGQRDHQKECEL